MLICKIKISMKAFYSILLLVTFILLGDAHPGKINAQSNNFQLSITDTLDSSTLIAAVTEKDSTSILPVPSIKKYNCLNGVASFYSKNLEGTETATGETFHHTNYTAASNNFDLNTWVRVTNMRNGKSVIVRINDRMHPRMAKKGRVVDLTISAAKKIGLTNHLGLARVKVEEVDKGTTE